MIRAMRGLLAIFMLLLMLSCTVSPPHQSKSRRSPPPADCWLLQPLIYRLRQSAKLEYRDKNEMFEGFMELDLKQNRAHLVIFSSLGLTLLDIEVEPHSYNLVEATTDSGNKTPLNRRKQQFAQAVASAIQHIFFSLGSYRETLHDHNPQMVAEFSGSPPQLIKISAMQPNSAWTVAYLDYDKGPAGWLPDRIILQNHKPDYRLTLWLHKAKLVEEVAR